LSENVHTWDSLLDKPIQPNSSRLQRSSLRAHNDALNLISNVTVLETLLQFRALLLAKCSQRCIANRPVTGDIVLCLSMANQEEGWGHVLGGDFLSPTML